MAEQSFMRVEEEAAELGVSKSYADKIVQRLNAALREGVPDDLRPDQPEVFYGKLCYNGAERKDSYCRFTRKKKRTH